MTGTTGTICQQSGDYKCQTHPSQVIPIAKGEKFPPCNVVGQGSHGTTWVLIKAR